MTPELAQGFSIIILMKSVDVGARVKVQLAQKGFEVFLLSDPVTSLESVRQTLPHLIFISTDFLKEPLNVYLQKIHSISTEIQIVLLGEGSEFQWLLPYLKHGALQVIDFKSPGVEENCASLAEEVCQKLYLTYQNEALLKDLKSLREQAEADKISKKGLEREMGSFRGLDNLVQGYRLAESKEQLVDLFMDQMRDRTIFYFKFLPSVKSLVVTHAQGLSRKSIEGVGCQLTDEENQDLHSHAALGVLPGSLGILMKQAFGLDQLQVLPVFVRGQLEGLFVMPADLDEEMRLKISEQFSVFTLGYGYFSLEKHLESVDLKDPLTEVYNSKYYSKKIQDEVQRARRLRQPLSVVKISLDDFDEIENSLGLQVRDHVLVSISQLLVKSIRAHDFVARLSENEFSMVLVHCSRRGAGLRAERLRKYIETSAILDQGVKLSISVGISEFPSLCEGAIELDRTASQALRHIQEKGGNRICLYKAAPEFKAEFEVSDQPGGLSVS